MADFPGFGADLFSLDEFRFQCNIPIPEFVEIPFDHDNSDYGYHYATAAIAGEETKTLPTTLEQDKAGVVVHSFSQDYYNRLHIFPIPVDFGSVTQQKTINLQVWNAFFDVAEYTGQITSGFDGISLDAGATPPPTIYIPALYNYQIPITAEVEGPGNLNGLLQLQITGKYSSTIPVVGRRTKLFPFVTSWDTNPIETFEYKTNIVETEQWEEHRYRLRAYPRRSFQLGIAAAGRGDSELRVSLMGSQGSEYALPVWMYETELLQQVLPGDNRVYVGTADSDFVVGEGIMILESSERFEVVEVVAVGDGYVDVDPDNGPSQLWYAGTKAYPVRNTRFSDTISLTSPAGNVSKATVNLDSLIPERAFSAHAFPLYKGHPVMTWMPNWVSGGKVSYKRKVELVDNGIYPATQHQLSTRYGEEQDFEWLLRNRTEVLQFRNLMNYMAGRHKPIWIPSWHNDMPIARTYTGTVELYANSSFATKYLLSDSTLSLHLRLLKKDGTAYYGKVEEVAPAPDIPTHDRIILDDLWPDTIPTYWVEDLSQISLVRLSSDSYDITWYTPQVAVAKITVVRVPEQPE